MSHGAEILGLGGDAASEPSFETALRGYEKKQVERYVARAENEIAALAQEREQAYSQIQAMAGQIDRLQQDVANALIGADGIWSSVRHHLFPEVQPQFSGLIAWRGTLAATALPREYTSPPVPPGQGPYANPGR